MQANIFDYTDMEWFSAKQRKKKVNFVKPTAIVIKKIGDTPSKGLNKLKKL